MADYKFNDSVVVLNKFDSFGMTHDSVEVTMTATLKQGSLLKADGTEAATADAADVVGVVDDLELLRKQRSGDGVVPVGSKVTIAVAKRGCEFNEAALAYKDGAINAAGKAALAVFINKFGTIGDDSQIVA